MPTRRRLFNAGRLFAVLTMAFVGLPSVSLAHDIPADIVVQAFVKPDGQQLQIVLRTPVGAIVNDLPQRGPGYLDFDRADVWLPTTASRWLNDYAEIYEGDQRLTNPRVVAARISLPSDKSFTSYEAAMAHVTMDPPLTNDTAVVWNQAFLDAVIEFPIRSDRSEFSVDPVLDRLGIQATTVIRFMPPGGATRAFEFLGNPGLVRLDPRWSQAALRFIELGFFHILGGFDHLLFLLCLVIPFRRLRPLVLVVSAFTLAHSITLFSSAYNLAPDALWFPPLIEALIAMSIVYMALENIVSVGLERRWMMAFGFGLVHGFGFSFALRQTLQFAGSHLLTSLFSFNVGVELGQLFVLALFVPALNLLFRFAVPERMGTILLSAIVAHTGWHWMIERGDRLRQFRLQWPTLGAAFLAGTARWLIVLVVAVGAAWLIFGVLRSALSERSEGQA